MMSKLPFPVLTICSWKAFGDDESNEPTSSHVTVSVFDAVSMSQYASFEPVELPPGLKVGVVAVQTSDQNGAISAETSPLIGPCCQERIWPLSGSSVGFWKSPSPM